MTDEPAELDYETPAARHGVRRVVEPGRTILAVPLSLAFDPIEFFAGRGLLYLLDWLWFLAARREAADRARFEVGPCRVRVTLHDPETGRRRRVECGRAEVIGLRRNRYEPGLWLHVAGRTRETILADLPPAALAWLDAELAAALDRHPPQGER